MKRFLALLAAVFAAAGSVFASPVTTDEAMAAANVWAAENVAFGAGNKAVSVLTVCDTNAAKTVLWHQVSMTGGGALMVAPVTEIEPVVAALEEDPGELPAAHPLRAILTADMRKRLRFLGLYTEDTPAVSRRLGMAAPGTQTVRSDEELSVASAWGQAQSNKWNRLLKRGSASTALKAGSQEGVADPVPVEIGIVKGFEKGGPLTHWNQENAKGGGYCYNYYTMNHVCCGCVATAMSAVMQYFACQGVCKWGDMGPEVVTDMADVPKSTACTYNGQALGTLACIGHSATAGEDPTFEYDWSIFDSFTKLEDYQDATKLDDAHRELLGRVAYNAGVMLNMSWSTGGSGAFSLEVVNALRDAFGFTDARYVLSPKQDQYEKLIYQQCWSGNPVIMGIEGHEVVAVGYGKDGDGVDRVRVFLGWGGSGDAWYALPYIDTKSVPGGSTYLSDTVYDVITMMSTEVVEGGIPTYPVCGHLLPSIAAEVDCGGTSLKSNSNGYFGFRAAAGSKVTVSCQGYSTQVEVGEEVKCNQVKHSCQLSDGSITQRTCKYECDAEDLCNAIPGTFLLPIITFETAVTTPVAQELALASGKLILAYSDPDSLAGLAVFNVFKKLAEANYCDCTNRYVFVALSYSDYSVFDFNPYSPSTQSDYNGTSYGVFDPEVFVPANRWAFTNGRLEYSRVCSYTLDGEGDPVATAETEAAIRQMLEHGWEQHLRSKSTIALEVTGNLGEAGTVSPDWGLHEPGCVDGIYTGYTNGEEVVFSSPEFVTNEVGGVVLKCVGWDVYAFGSGETVDIDGGTPLSSGSGCKGRFSAAEGTNYVLVWQQEVAKVKVSANVAYAADGNQKAEVIKTTRGNEVIDGDSVWCDSGDEVTFTVETVTSPVKYVLDDTVWSVSPKGTVYSTEVDSEPTLGLITVTAANQPVVLTITPHSSTKVLLAVTNSPAACAFGNPTPAYGMAYQWDNLHEASVSTDTVVSGGITWKCLGWQLTGSNPASGSTTNAEFVLSGASTLTWKWGIDLKAMAGIGWQDDPSTESVTVLDKLPAGVDVSEIEFASVPTGWKATPQVEGGKLVADLQVDAEEWAEENAGVSLEITNLVDGDPVTLDSDLAVLTNAEGVVTQLTVSVAAAYTNETAGIFYVPESWTAVDGDGAEFASGTGDTATFAATAGDEIALTWTWKAAGVRISAAIDGFVNGTDYSERFALDHDCEWLYYGETAEFRVSVDNSPAAYQFALKDWDVGNSTAFEKDYLAIRVTAKEEDGPVTVTAKFDSGSTFTTITYAACTNEVPVDSAFGSPDPAYGVYCSDGKLWNNQMLAKMDITVFTNIVSAEDATITNVWELKGWELRNAGGGAYDSGTGTTANFRVAADGSVFVWKWQLVEMPEPKPERGEPVPPLGPAGVSPMTFGEGTMEVNIANTVNGWWYGVYSKTDLASSEPWKYLKGFDAGNPATNLTFSIAIDPTESQRFYKIMLTEDEPVAE